jgi:ribosome maturation factor RimP
MPPMRDAAITVDDCARVSHAVSEVLEARIRSRGTTRSRCRRRASIGSCASAAHFERFVGAQVFVELKLPQDGRRRFAGALKAIEADSIVVVVDGREHRLPMERIQKARLRPE